MGNKKKLDFQISEAGCFIVTSHRPNKDGYCYVWHNHRYLRTHRFVYQELFGEIGKGLVVRHKCDVRNCINPEHLELGTHQENMKDRDVRKRNAHGERNGSSTINADDVRKIKIMLADGFMPRGIAKTLKVSLRAVRGIKEENRWSHIVI